MNEPKDQTEAACGGSALTAELGADLLTIQDFLRNQRNLAAEKEDELGPRFDDEYIEKQLRSIAAMRGDGNPQASLAYHAAECIARLRQTEVPNEPAKGRD